MFWPRGLHPKMIARYHPQDRKHVSADAQEAIAEATTFSHEARIVRPDGKIRYVLSCGQPECAADGTIVAIVGCVQDVTATKVSALGRERSQTQRNKAQQELKKPITTVKKGFWPALKRRGESGIRTLEPVAGLTVFKTVAFDRSANSPCVSNLI